MGQDTSTVEQGRYCIIIGYFYRVSGIDFFRKTAILGLLILIPVWVFPQTGDSVSVSKSADSATVDLIDYTIKILKLKEPDSTKQSDKRVRLSLVPFSSGSDRHISVSSVNLAFYRGDKANTNLSTVYFYPYTNFSGRYSFTTISNIWSPRNRYNTLADLKFSSNRYDDYGLGSKTSSDPVAELDYKHTRVHLQVKRLIFNYLYAGLGWAFDNYFNADHVSNSDSSDVDVYPYDNDSHTISSGMLFSLTRDSRKNSITPAGGFYTGMTVRISRPEFGSSTTWNSFMFDARKYVPLPFFRHSLIAGRGVFWDTWGETPYLDLPATLTDREGRMGRGYYYSRFRGKGMLYGELEYRFTISQNGFWGGVVFVNGQSLREPDNMHFEKVNPAGGFGLRLKFNKRSNANITLDFASGKDSFNWYLNLGEFF